MDWTKGNLAEGLRCYEAGEFFAAHEAWETVWLEATGSEKTFLQGLIQVTAAFHHYYRENRQGASLLLQAALQRLEQCQACFGGISVTPLCADIRNWLRQFETGRFVLELLPPRILPVSMSELGDNIPMSPSVVEAFTDDEPGQIPVRGYLHRAVPASGNVLILTHGAGGNCQTPLLVALAEIVAISGTSVLRCDLPFRQARPKGPPSPSGAERDRDGLRRAALLMRKEFADGVYLGGMSYGGRQASMLVASEPQLVKGLLLLSYPLHPPGRPAQMRTAHFPSLRTPVLLVHGEKDSFATSEELGDAVKLIRARTHVMEVAGAGHSLMTKRNKEELPRLIAQKFRLLADFN